MELEGKCIIITGASSGIGAAAARLFAAEGAKVVLAARSRERLQTVVQEIDDAGGEAVAFPIDVRDESHGAALVELALSKFGKIDGAFNNAGIVGDMVPVSEMSLANWNDVIAVNLTSAFLAARAQIPAIEARGGGSIVFTSSFVGNSNGGLPGMAAYAAAKAGLVGLTQALASEHAAKGVRVNALLPGGTVTPSGGEGNPDALEYIARLHPLKRMAQPEEIAQAALYMLSDRASFMTGSAMIVDGGISVRLS
jgi:NAD(P)-dependent dehydrogenase (short-subunit alcohol dehydrogenase family)